MSIVLLCYADGPQVHAHNQRALVASARRHGIDRIEAVTRPRLDGGFLSAHRAILAEREGAGYWLWKPRLILDALERSAADDIIVYVDSGALLRGTLDPLVAAARRQEGVLFWNDYPNWMHVKRDCFILTGTDTPRFHSARQLDAAFLLLRNTPRVRAFVRLWAETCADPRVLTDQPNTCGQPNLPGFTAHRHDQSVLTLLYLREAERLDFKTYARRVKHRHILHHRRRLPWLSIWAWHALHDGGEAWIAQARKRLCLWFNRRRRRLPAPPPARAVRDAFSA